MILTGKAYWAHITVPNTRFEPAYSVDLVVEDDVAEQLKAEGYNIKAKEFGNTIVLKRKVNKKDGTQRPAPKLMDAARATFSEAVGNGSLVRAQVRPWDTGTHKGFELQAVQVLEHVPYAGADGEEFDVEEDYLDGEEL